MIVEKILPKPVVVKPTYKLTLTHEEADLLWHLLNCGELQYFEAYAKEFNLINADKLKAEMWHCLDRYLKSGK